MSQEQHIFYDNSIVSCAHFLQTFACLYMPRKNHSHLLCIVNTCYTVFFAFLQPEFKYLILYLYVL